MTLLTKQTVDDRVQPLGLDNSEPLFRWRAADATDHTGYEIAVSTAPDFADQKLVWQSSAIVDHELGVPYQGQALRSGTRYWWRVRPLGADGRPGEWSEASWFETGLFKPSDWSASWVTSPEHGKKDRQALYFRTSVELSAPVLRARAYASALGWYRLFVNDTDLTGLSLVPRWTPFQEMVEYQVYDATAAFVPGRNVIGLVVAEGRYRGRLGFQSRAAVYGDQLAALAQVELELADGSTVTVSTDGSWTVGTGRVLSSDPKFGERVDLRISEHDWLRPDGSLAGEHQAVLLASTPGTLIAEEVERVTEVGRVQGTIGRTPGGSQLVDFGQNFAGVARVRLSGAVGSKVLLRYGEILRPDGELDTEYLGKEVTKDPAKWFQRDEVILAGKTFDYTPWFTIHGFRYLSIEGLEQPLQPGDVEGIVLSTELRHISEFQASDPRLEQLWRNVNWSLTSNFTDTATDCPQRERSGWTGDIQVFGPTAAQMVDSNAFLRRYLRNVSVDQMKDGRVPPFIPAEYSPGRGFSMLRFTSSSAGWGDVTVMLPWTLYSYFGDQEVLERQYPSAQAWVDHLAERARTKRRIYRRVGKKLDKAGEKFIVDTGYHWGEWLRPGEPIKQVFQDNLLGQPVVATAYLANSARLLSRIAELLGKRADAARYQALSAETAKAWRAAFVSEGGARIGEDKQDEYVRALAFDLLLPEQRSAAVQRLVQLITEADDHLGTGFLSTPLLLSTLADEGYSEVAYRILLQTTVPSWLGQIELGATSIWESWEGYNAKGRATMSHNHYAFGAVVSFLQEYIAGLSPAEPGYRRIKIAPVIGGGLTSASLKIETPFGLASSAWSVSEGAVRLRIDVPQGTEADLELGKLKETVGPGKHEFSVPLEQIGSAQFATRG
ncbi:family 78 glycoside hydrolase catalytic domain [Psychromicrobium sp. YIM B11713]|uniref:family 78 glycoside hydrolase catalytic domain n=1 Tax=Psychromicrobium sp. YIM B11713 TaxID=3145233 RepID=UPI00374FD46E